MNKIIYLPAIIDPHVHFRTPGAEHKEDFRSGTEAAKAGGISYVLDMPNTSPPTITEKDLDWKINAVSGCHSEERGIPASPAGRSKGSLTHKGIRDDSINVKFGFHFGATADNLDEIKKVSFDNAQDKSNKIVSIKIYFGSSTGDLFLNDLSIIEKIMRETDKIITVHAEDEDIIQKNIKKHKHRNEPKIHSLIRSPEAAYSAVEKLIDLVRKTKHPVYFCHISTKGEIDLIKKAKKEGLPVYAEVTPHHLFLDESAYKIWGNFVKVNPPLRTKEDRKALWDAINDDTVDTIGSDHAPHLPSEKKQDYWSAPSGIPGVETTLPLMLDAVNKGKLTLGKLIELMSKNPSRIFSVNIKGETRIDLDKKLVLKVNRLKTKCGWSPYEGNRLIGRPVKISN